MNWISVNNQLPKPEQRVMVCAGHTYNDKVYRSITIGAYEDGNMWREESDWNWNFDCNDMEYDEEQDDWKVPKGWYEYCRYNPDGLNWAIDEEVTHWMPLPELPMEE